MQTSAPNAHPYWLFSVHCNALVSVGWSSSPICYIERVVFSKWALLTPAKGTKVLRPFPKLCACFLMMVCWKYQKHFQDLPGDGPTHDNCHIHTSLLLCVCAWLLDKQVAHLVFQREPTASWEQKAILLSSKVFLEKGKEDQGCSQILCSAGTNRCISYIVCKWSQEIQLGWFSSVSLSLLTSQSYSFKLKLSTLVQRWIPLASLNFPEDKS